MPRRARDRPRVNREGTRGGAAPMTAPTTGHAAPSRRSWPLPAHEPASPARQAVLVTGLRAAHASGLALAEAAADWRRAAQSEPLRRSFTQLRQEAEETVRRVEHILAWLGLGARGAPCWMAPADLAAPDEADDAALVALCAWAVGRMTAGMLRLRDLAHDRREYQAARLLQMSAEGHLLCLRQVAGAARLAERMAEPDGA